MRNILLILTSIFLTAFAQLLLKKGMSHYGNIGGRAIWGSLDKVLKEPMVLLGLAALAVGFVLWLAVLSKNDLSYAYPLVSLSYVFVVFSSAWLFHERLDVWRILGVVLICLGVSFIAHTPHNTGRSVSPVAPVVEKGDPPRSEASH